VYKAVHSKLWDYNHKACDLIHKNKGTKALEAALTPEDVDAESVRV